MRHYLEADKVLNDGAWISLRVGMGNLEAEFVSLKGVAYRLLVGKVFEVTTFGFGLRNTVEGIYTEQITPDSVATVVEEFRQASSGTRLLGDVASISNHILREGMALFVVEPSEGGGLLAICDPESIKLTQINEDIR
jgi:hypothetical protein